MRGINEIKEKLKNALEIKSIVKTMKTISAVNIRQYEASNKAVSASLGILIEAMEMAGIKTSAAANKGACGSVIIGSDMGICGRFNETLLDYVLKNMEDDKTVPAVVGERMAKLAVKMRDLQPVVFEYPKSLIRDTPEVINGLIQLIKGWSDKESIETVDIYFNKPSPGSAYKPDCIRLYPFKIENKCREGIFHYLKLNELREGIIRQYIYAVIYGSFVGSLISENHSRLAAMQAAEKNIDGQIEQLIFSYNSERQSEVTAELLDIISSFEMLSGLNSRQNNA